MGVFPLAAHCPPGLPSPHPCSEWVYLPQESPQRVSACNFLPLIDLFFQKIHTFFIINPGLASSCPFWLHFPPDKRLGAKTTSGSHPHGLSPRFPIRNRDSMYGHDFARVIKASTIEVLKTAHPYQRPTWPMTGSWGA